MSHPFKPDGYASISPYIVADGAQRVIDFLVDAFGGEETRRYDADDGSILHAEVRIDDGVVMLSDGSEAYPPTPVIVHLYVPDVDASYLRALAAGAEAVDEPKEQEGDPDRRGSVRDPAGNTWAIATMRHTFFSAPAGAVREGRSPAESREPGAAGDGPATADPSS